MSETLHKGKSGEDAAAAYLQDKGCRILERNWHSGHREVDIIALKDHLLLIVEVKARSTDHFGEPHIFVDRRKQRLLISAANHYMALHQLDLEVRFDIISVLFTPTGPVVEHIEDAFYPC